MYDININTPNMKNNSNFEFLFIKQTWILAPIYIYLFLIPKRVKIQK